MTTESGFNCIGLRPMYLIRDSNSRQLASSNDMSLIPIHIESRCNARTLFASKNKSVIFAVAALRPKHQPSSVVACKARTMAGTAPRCTISTRAVHRECATSKWWPVGEVGVRGISVLYRVALSSSTEPTSRRVPSAARQRSFRPSVMASSAAAPAMHSTDRDKPRTLNTNLACSSLQGSTKRKDGDAQRRSAGARLDEPSWCRSSGAAARRRKAARHGTGLPRYDN
jgi:hypothetical protein